MKFSFVVYENSYHFLLSNVSLISLSSHLETGLFSFYRKIWCKYTCIWIIHSLIRTLPVLYGFWVFLNCEASRTFIYFSFCFLHITYNTRRRRERHKITFALYATATMRWDETTVGNRRPERGRRPRHKWHPTFMVYVVGKVTMPSTEWVDGRLRVGVSQVSNTVEERPSLVQDCCKVNLKKLLF